jgi:hypothetical protein
MLSLQEEERNLRKVDSCDRAQSAVLAEAAALYWKLFGLSFHLTQRQQMHSTSVLVAACSSMCYHVLLLKFAAQIWC